VSAALPEHAAGKPLEIWFQDEARVGQQGRLTRLWAKRGTRPRAPRDRRYAWTYLFGAICPARAVGAGLVLPFADKPAMNRHLAEIGRCICPGAHGVLVLDGAGWHSKSGKSRGSQARAQRALTRSDRNGTAGASRLPSRAPR
jgi:hypothetical protein